LFNGIFIESINVSAIGIFGKGNKNFKITVLSSISISFIIPNQIVNDQLQDVLHLKLLSIFLVLFS